MNGTARCCGHDLTNGANSARRILGTGETGVVFQDPISALSPMRRIGPQICTQTARLQGVSKSVGKRLALDLLRRTGIPDPEDRYHRYPHEMSGGMLQRAMIALALAGKPRMLIADEPTTALDAAVQAQILELIRDIRRTEGPAVILITHDIGIVATVADRVVVLYAGKVAETGATESLFSRPGHPYTQALISAVPSPDPRVESRRTRIVLKGAPPSPMQPPTGCRFNTPCMQAESVCTRSEPALAAKSTGTLAACHLVD